MKGYTSLQPNLPIRRGPAFYSLPRKYDESVTRAMLKQTKKQRIMAELKQLDVGWYGMLKTEVAMLPAILHDDEHIKGVVYGHHIDGSALLVATDHRILFVDKKPMFLKTDEMTYDIVSGVSFGRVGLRSTVVLRTRTGNYAFTTMNPKAAKHLIDYIEDRCLDQLETISQTGSFKI